MSDQLWYRDGLRFTCTQCGDCCTGAPGFVWLREEDIRLLAESLALDVDTFERRYVRRVGVRQSLIELPGGDCVFFDPVKRNCSVYQSRPLQCRTWPFWDSNIESPQSWQRTCQRCPGSGHGKLYSVEQILEQSSAMRL